MSISRNQFANALSSLPLPGGRQLQFLAFHEQAKSRALTATMLSKEVGYVSYRPINLLYGKLARSIADFLDLPRARLDLLCDFFKPGELTNTEWILVMKPEFAEALRKVRWID